MRLLLISYYFPPMGGIGVQRALKFSKYLGEFGVTVQVLAAHDASYAHDASLLEELPADVPVHRVAHTPLLQRALAWRQRVVPAGRATLGQPGAGGPVRAPFWRDVLLSTWGSLRFPDDKSGWARRAYADARSWLHDSGIDMIFSTAPPMSAHALAARLAIDSNLPWVADFRDLWSDNPGYAAPPWRKRFDQRTEAAWLRQVSGVVTVTPSWQALLEARLRGRCPVAFIPNGYDEADFAGLDAMPARDDAEFRLLHAGSFYGPRDPATLLEGLARFIEHDPRLAQPLRLRLVGQIGSRFVGSLARFDQEHPGVVECLPYMAHRHALAEMMAADALLLMVGAGGAQANGAVVAGWLPGKIFEYLRAARPTLLLGNPQGDAAELLRRHGRGWVADETKPEQIALALQRMMQAPRSAAAAPPSVAQFERRALAGELATFLRRCR